MLCVWGAGTECTKIAYRRSLAISTADEGIARNSAARTIFTHFLRRRNRGSLAMIFAEEIAHLGASKNRAILWGSGKNRRRSRRESHDFGALSPGTLSAQPWSHFTCSTESTPRCALWVEPSTPLLNSI